MQPAATPAVRAAAPLPAPPAVPARRPRKDRANQTTLQRQVTAADEAAFSTMEAELGGRPALAAILAGADLNNDEARVAGLLADPLNDNVSLAKVCLGAGLSMNRLLSLFQAAALAKGRTKAVQRIAEKLPDVAAGVMEDAIGGEKVCTNCNGFQFLPKPTDKDPLATEKCATCLGKGTVLYQPDHHIREIALKIGGLLDKGGGNKVVIAQQFGPAGGAGATSFDQLMSAMDGALYGEGRARARASGGPEPPVDGEVIE